MTFQEATLPFVDLGNTPKIYVDGLAKVVSIGQNALFTFYTLRPRENGEEYERLAEVCLLAPQSCIGPAIGLTVTTLGAATTLAMTGGLINSALRGRVPH